MRCSLKTLTLHLLTDVHHVGAAGGLRRWSKKLPCLCVSVLVSDLRASCDRRAVKADVHFRVLRVNKGARKRL